MLQQFALEPHSSDPSHEGRWAIEVAQSLGGVASRHRLSGTSAIAVPGHLALTKFIKTPSVAKERRRKIVEFEAAENIPYPLAEVVWDHVVVADDGFDLEVMLTAVKFDAMQTLCGASDSAGFPVERALPAGLALRNAFRYNYPGVRESVIVANVGARSTHLLFVEGDRFYLRTLPHAGNMVTQAIAEELRIDFAQAETLKTQVLSGRSDLPVSSPSRAAVQRATTNFIARLHLEITRSSVNHRRQTGAAAPEAVYVTGGGSLIPDLPELLAERLKLRVQRYEPLRAVDLSADARAAGAEGAEQVMADLVGLATRLVVKDEPDASLLPPAIIQAIEFKKRQPVYLAAAAMVVLALLAPLYYFHRVASATQQQVSAYDDQLMPLRSVQTRNENNLQAIEAAKKQIAALRGAYETKANWINFFSDLQSRLARIEDVWLDRLHVIRPPLEELAEAAAVTAAAEAAAASAEAQPPGEGAPAEPPLAPKPPPPVKLTLSGRLLDVANPQTRVSSQSLDRVKQLLASFTDSQFITTVEQESFDPSQNGLLKFDFTVVVSPKKPL